MQALSQLSYGPILGRARSRRAGRAFQALIFILIVKNEWIIIVVIISIDVERIIVLVIIQDSVVIVIIDAFFGEASRHLGAGCFFLIVFRRAFENDFGFIATEFLGVFLVIDFVFVVIVGVVFALAFTLGADEFLVFVIIIVVIIRLDGGASSFCLHLRDRGFDNLVFGIELIAAFWTNSGAFVEVVKAGFAVWADLLGSEFVFRHGAAPSGVSMILVWAGACHERRALSKPEFTYELRKRNILMVWTSRPVSRLKGIIRAPGDKSCSHRALIMGGIAEGTSHFTGLLEGDDVLRTGTAMSALGATVTRTGAGEWKVVGTGTKGLTSPTVPLDFGNSGTGSRLMMGLMAGYELSVELCGDASLSARPMNRILDPLRSMGLEDTAEPHGRLPFRLTGSPALNAIDYAPPQASAQVKSAVLLAGLNAIGTTRVVEAKPTRDHTERMLRGFGVDVGVTRGEGQARTISLVGGQRLSAIEAAIPGDPSSAAFLIAAGLISPDGDVMVEGVMSNPTRSGFFDLASLMGARLGAEDTGDAAGERLIDIQSGTAALIGRAVPERLVASMIDEFPILGVLAAFATGETIVTGAEELRVKETDRVKAVVDMLRVNGVNAEERADGFIVQGCGGPPPGGGFVETRHDHRIAMSALVMGTASQKPVSVDDVSMIDTSYPDFLSHLATLGADISDT